MNGWLVGWSAGQPFVLMVGWLAGWLAVGSEAGPRMCATKWIPFAAPFLRPPDQPTHHPSSHAVVQPSPIPLALYYGVLVIRFTFDAFCAASVATETITHLHPHYPPSHKCTQSIIIYVTCMYIRLPSDPNTLAVLNGILHWHGRPHSFTNFVRNIRQNVGHCYDDDYYYCYQFTVIYCESMPILL